ncbi:nucleotide pyrophosphohydrolase [Actinokineospora soli]|uniref:Nucleotide pyrophosphohydrolase n=1 Tax=Actinokineospora soli TaxID=1048753 RepID=A0ABW2U058_9PSEU
MSLDDIAARQRAFAVAREWGQWHTPKNLVMALSGEVGELTEIFQWLTPEQAAAAYEDPDLRARIDDELADVLLYLVRLADVMGADLVKAAHAKIDRNEHRFPKPAPLTD